MYPLLKPSVVSTRSLLSATVRSALALLILGSLAHPAIAEGPHPLQIAAQFFSLSEEQIESVVAIEESLSRASQPIFEEIVQSRQMLGELVSGPDPDPAEVGTLVLLIRDLEQEIGSLRAATGEELEGLLEPDQLLQLETVSAAQPLCRVVPALQALHWL